MKKYAWGRCLSGILMIAMLLSLITPVYAVEDEGNVHFTQVDDSRVTASLLPEISEEPLDTDLYDDNEVVRVSIFMEGASTLERGYSATNIAENRAAATYRQRLLDNQLSVTQSIEDQLGEELDVKWNLTLAANLISANVKYGQIEEILQVEGVKEVVIEQQYYPAVIEEDETLELQMVLSTGMTGMNKVQLSGYTGAGSRIAIIDTGLDPDHQSFAEAGYLYSLEQNAAAGNMSLDEYKAQLNLLTYSEVAGKVGGTNAYVRLEGLTANDVTFSEKVPFGFNYVDINLNISHDKDKQTDHGSHVAGIAAANRYIKEADGTYSVAADKYKVVGNAPDAQLIVMKVFGANGGGSDSDIVAACEDAIWLGADSINLSLGSTANGFTTSESYARVMETLKGSTTVMAAAAANDGHWADRANTESYLGSGYLYTEDVVYNRLASPGSLTDSLAVASVNNSGQISDAFFTVIGANGEEYSAVYNETLYNDMRSFNKLDTATDGGGTVYDFVVIDGLGNPEDFEYVDLEGKIAVVIRGELPFYEKAINAVEHGAVATIIYNNANESINMDLTSYTKDAPCISVTLEVGKKIISLAQSVTDEASNRVYHVGKMKVVGSLTVMNGDAASYEMSYFSSWGVPGDLSLKPEITAPGGGIYSVKGDVAATNRYKTNSGTSMATPQVAGIVAAFKQYMRESGLAEKFGNQFSERQLTQSLIMSTAIPMKDSSGNYYPVMQQGAGLINGDAMIKSTSLIMMQPDATASWADGKVKAELGDDPDKTGEYTFSFTIYNGASVDQTYQMSADLFAQDCFEDVANAGSEYKAYYTKKSTIGLDSTATFKVGGVVKSDGKITVEAGTSVTVTVELKLTYDALDWLDWYYPLGTYIQGYVFVDPLAYGDGINEAAHSIPVLAFYGNWTDPSMFDAPSTYHGEYITNYSTPSTTDNSRMAYVESYQALAEEGRYDVPLYGLNHVTVRANGRSTYAFGGNPLVRDEKYMPERDAISQNTVVGQWSYVGIRDFNYIEMGVRNLTTGESLDKWSYSKSNFYGSYYSKSSGIWQNAAPTWNANYAIPEQNDGDIIEIYLTTLPEYYSEGKMGENSTPGVGATLKISGPVDDTAPVVSDITYNSDGTLSVTAADSNYIAAVVLYNSDGTKVVSYTGAKQEIEKGESAVYTVDTEGNKDNKFMLQVYDYAMNPATYYMEIDESEITYSGSIIAYDLEEKTWVQLSKLSDKIPAVSKTIREYTAATSVGNTIYAVADTNALYKLSVDDPETPEFIATLAVVPVDLAYNSADGNIYAVTNDSKLVRINPKTGGIRTIGATPIQTNTLACDENGVFYSNLYDTGKVYSYTQDSVKKADLTYDFDGDGTLSEADSRALLDYVTGKRSEIANLNKADFDGDGDVDTYDVRLSLEKITSRAVLVADNGLRSKYMQSMEFDPNDGILYWSSYSTEFVDDETEIGFSVLYGFNTVTGEYIRYDDVWDQMSCLLVLDKDAGSIYEPPDGSSGLGGYEDKLYTGINEQSSIAVACGVDNSKKAAYLASVNERKTVTVTLAAQNDTYNALYTLTYDPEVMTLRNRVGNGEFNSFFEADGSITFGYVSGMALLSGETAAEFTFETTSCEASAQILIKDENETNPAAVTTVDTGSHEWGEWEETPATCTEDGERSRTCSKCNGTDTEILPADGKSHVWGEWSVITVATNSSPGLQKRICQHCNKAVDQNWKLNSGMVSTAVTVNNGTIQINEAYIAEAKVYNAGIHKAWRLTTEDGSIRYMVELTSQSESDELVKVRLEQVAINGSGAGYAIRKTKVDSVQWESNELDYEIELEGGAGKITAYSYYVVGDSYDGERCVTELDIYFIVVDEDGKNGELTYTTAPDGVKIGVWESEVTKFYWTENSTSSNSYECFVWLAPELEDDATIALEFKGANSIYLLDEYGNKTGGDLSVSGYPIQLKDGMATVRFYKPSYRLTPASYYTIHIRNHQNYAPIPTGDGTGSINIVVGRTTLLDLDQFFYDFDGDTLSYKVSVNGGTPYAIGNPHELRPEAVNKLSLEYTAYDGFLSSLDTFKLQLNVVAVGDVDADGDVDANDVLALRQYLAGMELDGICADAGDVNNDGKVSLVDCIILSRYVAGWSGVTLG